MAEPRKLRYVGPHDEVAVPALGKSVRRNHQVEVEDAAVAKSLLAQDTWEEVGAKAAAAKREDATAEAAPKSGG
jgi:hypothetical protein